MSSTPTISLAKRVEAVKISLAKKSISVFPPVKIVSIFDVSGSMRGAFTARGNTPSDMQATFDRTLAVAASMDDDGIMEVYAFDTGSYRLPDANLNDYGGYIDDNIANNSKIYWGGTSYVPVLREVIAVYTGTTVQQVQDELVKATEAALTTAKQAAQAAVGWVKGLFGKKEEAPKVQEVVPVRLPVTSSVIPATVLFYTDGESGDLHATQQLLESVSHMPIYFHIIAVGSYGFNEVKRMANALPNAGFVQFDNFNVSDEEVYGKLITDKFASWMKQTVGAK